MKSPASALPDLRDARTELARPGESRLSGLALWRLGSIGLSITIVAANLVGLVTVLVLAIFVVPVPPVTDEAQVRLVNAAAAVGYFIFAVPLGVWIGIKALFGLRLWLKEERPATPKEKRLVLHAPLRLFFVQAGLWLIAAALFGALNLSYSAELALRVVIIIVVTGLVTASCAYLLAERIARPAASRALADGLPKRLVVPGVVTRAVLAWGLGTGLPVLGVMAVGLLVLAGDDASRQELGIAMVVLAAIGIVVGLLAVILAARATADPIRSVRKGLAQVERGEFDVQIPVYDGSQIGRLQIGFNATAAGLAERERIRDTFGTYVDPEVAAHVLEEGAELKGEEVEITIMFIDIRDFTGFAEKSDAADVVAAVNRLYERIVPIIHEHGGRVDKFIGDGLMAVFGAPRRREDHADRALAAALEIEADLGSEGVDELPVGIGLNSGKVVAGNVGGAGRLEFSVIGDPVNVASRVEAATRETGDTILVAKRTKELLRSPSCELVERDGVTLKGKTDSVSLYAPGEG
ncbi:MAG: adenylate/guanylate cyclase domain-containing protein [Actinomycetota bacterium]|nr:adenylate/guanylate cyclase domain-containing protein [Actinomycetota bacterium]